MFKKILLLVFFLSFTVFIPAVKVNAATANVYVGVQVQTATAPGYNSVIDSNWCLITGTQISIFGPDCSASGTPFGSLYTGNCVLVEAVTGSGTNTINTTLSPTCASGNIIWSGLLNLTTSTNYAIQLYTPNFCPGTYYGYNIGACWVAATDKNCSDMCSYYGTTPIDSSNSCANDNFSYATNYGYSTNCGVIESLKGSACTTCNAVAGTNYNYYNSSTGACYYTDSYGIAPNCDALGAGLVRACACNFGGWGDYFYFSFTTPAVF